MAPRRRVNHALAEPERLQDLFPPPHLIISVLTQHTWPARGICGGQAPLWSHHHITALILPKLKVKRAPPAGLKSHSQGRAKPIPLRKEPSPQKNTRAHVCKYAQAHTPAPQQDEIRSSLSQSPFATIFLLVVTGFAKYFKEQFSNNSQETICYLWSTSDPLTWQLNFLTQKSRRTLGEIKTQIGSASEDNNDLEICINLSGFE